MRVKPFSVLLLLAGCETTSEPGLRATVTFHNYETNVVQTCGMSEADDLTAALTACPAPKVTLCQQKAPDKEWALAHGSGASSTIGWCCNYQCPSPTPPAPAPPPQPPEPVPSPPPPPTKP
jgi:hypothetical protein